MTTLKRRANPLQFTTSTLQNLLFRIYFTESTLQNLRANPLQFTTSTLQNLLFGDFSIAISPFLQHSPTSSSGCIDRSSASL
jgi:hypothetical protein